MGRALSGWQTRLCHGSVPGMTTSPNPYRGFRFPAEIIEHAVWLYHCFSLSLRDVETILAARGVVVSYESIREWGLRFGRLFANTLKRSRPKPGDKWHLDEVFLRIQGKTHYLWRAVDQHGHVLDILVQSRRNARAAGLSQSWGFRRRWRRAGAGRWRLGSAARSRCRACRCRRGGRPIRVKVHGKECLLGPLSQFSAQM